MRIVWGAPFARAALITPARFRGFALRRGTSTPDALPFNAISAVILDRDINPRSANLKPQLTLAGKIGILFAIRSDERED